MGKTVAQQVKEGMAPLFRSARANGLWFHCSYQDLWFSPDELESRQKEGKFVWGAVNWTLRKPSEHIAELERRAAAANQELESFKDRV